MSNTAMKSNVRDAEIAQEVARIRDEHPYQGNYREQMAALLSVMFFKFGERVGANRLAALLAENGRSPSTSTAQDEINKFWDRLRKHAAIKIDRPDVPQFLLDLYADMAGKVWVSSMDQASSMFEAHRQEVATQLQAAQHDANQAREQLAVARAGSEQALQSLQVANEHRETLGAQLAAETAQSHAAEARAGELAEHLARERQVRAEESLRTQGTLQDLKAALEQAAAEQRRLLVIGDDFKQQAARDRALRVKSEEAQASLANEVGRLRQHVTQLSGEKGVLEGRLEAQGQQLERFTFEHERHAKAGQLPVRVKKVRPGLRTRIK